MYFVLYLLLSLKGQQDITNQLPLKTNIMNLASGQSSQKEHLRNGSKTACNRRTSGIGISEFKDYKWNATNYPEHCCKVCLAKYYEQLERLNKKANI